MGISSVAVADNFRVFRPAMSRAPQDREALPAALEIDDGELVERVRVGDPEAFDELVRRHMTKAFSIAYRLLGHREDAEDLVQDAFMAALEKIDTFQTGRSFAPWLYKIVVNRGLNARKSRSLRRMDPLPPEGPAALGSPLLDAERDELRTSLSTAMAELPDRQRSVVQLVEIEGFTSTEVAEMLGLSDGTVRWHLHQARQRLRTAMAPFARRTE